MSWRSSAALEVEARAEEMGIDPSSPEEGRYSRMRCPACLERTGKDDYRGALSISHGNGWVKCHKCNWRMRLSGWDDGDLDRPYVEPEKYERKSVVTLPSGYKALFTGALCTQAAEKWVVSRGVNPQVAVEAEVGVSLRGEDAGRIIVPIRNVSGELLGWIRRPLKGGGNISSKGLGRPLYRPDVLLYGDGPVGVVEGVWDAMALWNRAVACLGKPSPMQIRTIGEAAKKSNRIVVVVLDGDAWEAGWSTSMALRLMGVRSESVRLPAKADPDDFPNLFSDIISQIQT